MRNVTVDRIGTSRLSVPGMSLVKITFYSLSIVATTASVVARKGCATSACEDAIADTTHSSQVQCEHSVIAASPAAVSSALFHPHVSSLRLLKLLNECFSGMV